MVVASFTMSGILFGLLLRSRAAHKAALARSILLEKWISKKNEAYLRLLREKRELQRQSDVDLKKAIEICDAYDSLIATLKILSEAKA